MKIAALARQLLDELKSAQDKDSELLRESPEIKTILKKLIVLECKNFCREDNEKSSTCHIKICCVERKITGCWECLDIDSCKKLKPQFIRNNKKLKKLGIEEYIKQYE